MRGRGGGTITKQSRLVWSRRPLGLDEVHHRGGEIDRHLDQLELRSGSRCGFHGVVPQFLECKRPINVSTRSTSTGFSGFPSRLKAEPMMKPSAWGRKVAIVSAVTPLPM